MAALLLAAPSLVYGASSAYTINALIGSVLNNATISNNAFATKTLQGPGLYTFQELQSLIMSSPMSPYAGAGGVVPFSGTSPLNSGGVTFLNGFDSGSGTSAFANLVRLTSVQLPNLLNNYGANQENEVLWFAGFPVFDQQAGVNNFRVLSTTGAYQITFSIPIQINASATTSLRASAINIPIRFLGQNYTLVNAYSTLVPVTNTNTVTGGQITLGASLTQPQTVYVSNSITTGPFTVVLQNLGQPNSGGVSAASVAVYYNGVLTNTSSIFPGTIQKFTPAPNQNIYVNVMKTFAGLYAYQKWAQIQLYSNILNLASASQTPFPGWNAALYWTNTTASSVAANAVALQSIVLYNTTPTTLAPGQSFVFARNQNYNLTFTGDSLAPGNFDAVTVATSSSSAIAYQNNGLQYGVPGLFISNITEPAQLLTVTSQIPNAFSYAGCAGSSVVYDLTPYMLNEYSNVMAATSRFTAPFKLLPGNDNIALSYSNPGANAIISNVNPLTVFVTGYTSNAATTQTTYSNTFTANSGTVTIPSLFNVTGIRLSRAIPDQGFLSVAVWAQSQTSANAIELANLSTVYGPAALCPISGKAYQSIYLSRSPLAVTYNTQNGQPTTSFLLSELQPPSNAPIGAQQQYYTYTIKEIAVPSTTAIPQTAFSFAVVNSSAGVAATPFYQINYSSSFSSYSLGTKNNITYVSTQSGNGQLYNVGTGFISERGSKVVSITPTAVAFNLARNVDNLALNAQVNETTPPPPPAPLSFVPPNIIIPNTIIEVGQSEYITAKVVGGVPPYTYSWSLSGKPLGQTTQAILLHANTSDIGVSIYYLAGLKVNVSDSAGNTTSAFAWMSIQPSVYLGVPNITIFKAVLDPGQSESITANAFKGLNPHTYIWKMNGQTLGQSLQTIVFYANTSDVGKDNIQVTAVDGSGNSTTGSGILTVSPPLLESLSSSSVSVKTGNSVTFIYNSNSKAPGSSTPVYVTVTGGTPPYKDVYYYDAKNSNIVLSGNTFTFNAAGTYGIGVIVADSTGYYTAKPMSVIVSNPSLFGSVSAAVISAIGIVAAIAIGYVAYRARAGTPGRESSRRRS